MSLSARIFLGLELVIVNSAEEFFATKGKTVDGFVYPKNSDWQVGKNVKA